MAAERNFRFVSPGIFITELDRSQVPATPEAIGPVIIGRAQRGPVMSPTKVSSFSEFVTKFGRPVPGSQQPGDVWRNGALNSPMYGTYAAQAHLLAGDTPLTYVRLAGVENNNATADTFGEAGFDVPTAATNPKAEDTAGAFGLFLFGSASAGAGKAAATGTLAAVLYASGTAIYPTGTAEGGVAAAGMNILFDLGTTAQVDLVVSSSAGTSETYKVSFDENDPNYIRSVLNTNPQLSVYRSDAPVASVEDPNKTLNYWLGETFERSVKDSVINTNTNYFAAVLPLNRNGAAGYANRRSGYREAQTPWFISQDLSANSASFSPADRSRAIPLFKFVSLNGQGQYANSGLKVSIGNVQYSPNDKVSFGTFDVFVRNVKDTDGNIDAIETFTNCNLDPNSSNYIVARIGDSYRKFDDTTRTLKEYGDFPNRSNLVRVVVSTDVAAGDTPALLPFGYYGVPKYETVTQVSGARTDNYSARYIAKGGFTGSNGAGAAAYVMSASTATGTVNFPSFPTRVTASDVSDARTDFFGVSTTKTETSTTFDEGYVDYGRFLGEDVVGATVWTDNFGLSVSTLPTGVAFEDAFTLDNVVVVLNSDYNFSTNKQANIARAVYTSGSRAAGTSFTATSSGAGRPPTATYKNIIDAGFTKFTAPFFGGFDGFSVYERDPLRNRLMDGQSPTLTNNYVLNTYRTALDILTDAEQFEYNLLSVPGVWYSGVTDRALEVCEQRGDALAVIDVKGGYNPPHEQYVTDPTSRKGTVEAVVNDIDTRNLNNSYGAAYYPWVLMQDTISATSLRVPPTVPAIGVLANTERVADVWFAPAGFNRGGISNGSAGISVVNVDEVLNARDRDRLYSRNINPIARFPAEGIVVFGQKTLQATPSALDRINVRRLLIFLKKGISQIAATTLFEQNVPATWNRFRNAAESFLSSVKIGFGLDDYRVVLDETTTTPDLVDRNILYAKVYIKPTRSIEFIALDFIITRSGASFDD